MASILTINTTTLSLSHIGMMIKIDQFLHLSNGARKKFSFDEKSHCWVPHKRANGNMGHDWDCSLHPTPSKVQNLESRIVYLLEHSGYRSPTASSAETLQPSQPWKSPIAWSRLSNPLNLLKRAYHFDHLITKFFMKTNTNRPAGRACQCQNGEMTVISPFWQHVSCIRGVLCLLFGWPSFDRCGRRGRRGSLKQWGVRTWD